jgi:hypothetical protein
MDPATVALIEAFRFLRDAGELAALAPAIDRWQAALMIESDREPTDAPPDGFEPAGPWEPIGGGVRNGRVNGGPEDMEPVLYWRRPLRAIAR